MKMLKQIKVLEEVNYYIKQQKTGSPSFFASKIGISRSHLYNIIDFIQFNGAEVKYCRKRKTFLYINTKGINIDFSITLLQ